MVEMFVSAIAFYVYLAVTLVLWLTNKFVGLVFTIVGILVFLDMLGLL